MYKSTFSKIQMFVILNLQTWGCLQIYKFTILEVYKFENADF